MVGIYFSGTGNTKYCIEKFLHTLDSQAAALPIENPSAAQEIKNADEVVFAYPVYYSDLPKIVRDFICESPDIWRGKRVFIIATMGLFSGDGAGCSARLLKKYGATVIGGLHLKMPDCIGDVKLLKKPLDENRQLIKNADAKIEKAAENIKRGKYPKDGLGFFCHFAGLFGQRLYFRNKTKKYYNGVKADGSKCVACGLCASVCPLKNIVVDGGKAMFGGKCTMCYRCFSICPQKAITIIGKKVLEQSRIEKYLDGEEK